MDAGDLRMFEAVARLGGMNRAAAELNTVQSNVTTRIRMLEQELGTALFQRHSRGVVPTAAGQRLLPYAVSIARLLQDARRAAVDDGTPQGALTIGSLETTAAIRLSPVLARYAETWPDVDLILRTGTTAELVEAVLEHRLEGAFVCGPVDHPDLAEETVFREELMLVTDRTIGGVTDLADRPALKIVVLRAGCSYRQRLEEILARRGIVGLRLLEFGTLETIVSCVAGGLGVTLLPRRVIEAMGAETRVSLHAFPANEALVETQFIRRRDAYVSSALAAFTEMARRPLDGEGVATLAAE